MRVLHFYKTSFPDTMGGVEQVINQIARGAVKLGVQTDVLSLTRARVARTMEIDGYLAHRARLHLQIASTGFSASVFLRFFQLAKMADVIHYHFPWPFMDVVHFATAVKKPTVVTYHSDIIRQERLLKLYRPLKRRFLASVDCIVATSPNYLATSDVLAMLSNKVTVIDRHFARFGQLAQADGQPRTGAGDIGHLELAADDDAAVNPGPQIDAGKRRSRQRKRRLYGDARGVLAGLRKAEIGEQAAAMGLHEVAAMFADDRSTVFL